MKRETKSDGVNATLHARMVKGKPRVILAFEPGDITVAQIGGTIIETMFRMVGPVTMERGTETQPARLQVETCSAKWARATRSRSRP